jgi:NTP pyrophosphatase (non-canonical NTP hydrolase)
MESKAIIEALRKFVNERDWEKFHTPSNLAKSISIESAELLELFQWSEDADVDRVREELADVLTYCLLMVDKLNLDPTSIVLEKLEKTAQKYPVEKSKGTSDKYDRL